MLNFRSLAGLEVAKIYFSCGWSGQGVGLGFDNLFGKNLLFLRVVGWSGRVVGSGGRVVG